MKKLFYSLLTMLTAIFALSSCEDVPAPYDIPQAGGGNTATEIAPAGDGTLADPFNVEGVQAFIAAGENLDQKVYIKGYVTSVKECSPSFGNATFYIASVEGGTNTFYVYRCNGLNNSKITSEDQIKEGDEVVVYGKVTDYNGTKETVQKEAYIYSINGEGGNGGGNQGTPGEPKGNGTQTDPYNATAANAFIATLAADTESANDIYVKGIVTEITEAFSSYGNATFYIADSNESSDKFYCFRALGLGNKQCKDPDALKVGDEVIVCGKVVNYKGNTPETVQNKAYIYSLNGKTDGGSTTPEVTPGTPAGAGTAADPFNVAAAIKKCQEVGETATAEQYYVKGIVETVSSTGVDQYGNITIDIVDVAGSSEIFKAFQVNSINGEKFTAATAAGIKKGDVIVVKGNLVNYKGNTPETTGKGAGCVVSVNGKTTIEGGGTGGNTGGGTETGDYATTLNYTLGANAYDDGVATVNGVENVKIIKIGTSKAAGEFTLSLPAGKTTFYAVTWKGTASADVKIGSKTVTVKGNDGAANNSPYTLSVTSADKYEISVDAATTVTVTSDKRILFFAIQQAK